MEFGNYDRSSWKGLNKNWVLVVPLRIWTTYF